MTELEEFIKDFEIRKAKMLADYDAYKIKSKRWDVKINILFAIQIAVFIVGFIILLNR